MKLLLNNSQILFCNPAQPVEERYFGAGTDYYSGRVTELQPEDYNQYSRGAVDFISIDRHKFKIETTLQESTYGLYAYFYNENYEVVARPGYSLQLFSNLDFGTWIDVLGLSTVCNTGTTAGTVQENIPLSQLIDSIAYYKITTSDTITVEKVAARSVYTV